MDKTIYREFMNGKLDDVIAYKDKILNSVNDYKDSRDIYLIAYALFLKHDYDDLDFFILSLKSKGVERLDSLFFFFISAIIRSNTYIAKAYISSSKLLNSNEILKLFDGDTSTLDNIKKYSDIDAIPTLLMFNYLLEVSDEEEIIDYICKYYEMIDVIYSLGYDNSVVKFLEDVGKIAFSKI